jgi:hypothetical protein
MATTNITLTGKSLYARPWKNQIDREYEHDTKGGNWSTKIILDDASKKLFNALGSRAKLKDGALTVRRYEFADFGKGPEELGPPVVTGVDEGTLIGNDSDISVDLEVYTFEYKGKPGVGIRWVSMEVQKLVPYSKPESIEDTEALPF